MRELNITTREEGQRLDKILSKYLNKAPKSFVYKMLRKKNIKLNGKKATGNEKLSQGDQVCIYLAEDTINKFREEVKAGKQKNPPARVPACAGARPWRLNHGEFYHRNQNQRIFPSMTRSSHMQ